MSPIDATQNTTQQSPPLRQIGARLLLLLAWASSGNLLCCIKQTCDKRKDSLSEANVPLNHIIKVLDIIRCVLLASVDDP